jgi:type VI secretion system protein ImpL
MKHLTEDRRAANNVTIQRMFDAYLKQYAEYWQTFARKFSEIAVNVEEDQVYAPFVTAKNLLQTPHLRLIQRMSRELAPLKDANPRLPWLEDAHLFEVMYAVALEGHAEKDPAAWHTLLVAGTRMPDVLKTLWEKADNREHMREIYDGIMDMTLYLSSVREILNTLENPARSLALARAHFGGKDTETLQKSPYTQAKDRLATALKLFDNSDVPQKQVFGSLLDFAGHGVAVKAALALQTEWETKVLSSPVTRYRSDDSSKMYGADGVVTVFVNTEAAPFLQFHADGITAAVWDGRAFPFTEDFLAFLHSSEEWAMSTFSSATAEQSVVIRSSPPLVNVDAKSRPNSVTLTLFCRDKNWQTVNRNYPHSERFVFDKTKCGLTDIVVAFPNFEITKRYRSFIAFLEDFQYGEKDFVPRDFPEVQGMLEEANVKTLKLRLITDGVGMLLREESEKAPLVPELITYVRK